MHTDNHSPKPRISGQSSVEKAMYEFAARKVTVGDEELTCYQALRVAARQMLAATSQTARHATPDTLPEVKERLAKTLETAYWLDHACMNLDLACAEASPNTPSANAITISSFPTSVVSNTTNYSDNRLPAILDSVAEHLAASPRGKEPEYQDIIKAVGLIKTAHQETVGKAIAETNQAVGQTKFVV